jgi:molybdate transport system ATP-binding protein
VTGDLAFTVTAPGRGIDAKVSVASGRVLALLGPNGSGKTTILEALAGLLPDAVVTPAAPERVALVTQRGELFPTMSVVDNVAFPPRARGMKREPARELARSWLERVGAADLATRRPTELSGGQARRVAIARALASSPEVILLDEPFAGLDLEAATSIRALLAEELAELTAIIATHTTLDAYALASHIAVLEGGGVVESGPVARVLTKPRTPFAARMAGRVLITGTPEAAGIRLGSGELVACETEAVAEGATAAIAVHPRDVAVDTTGIADVVTALEPHGDLVRVHGSRLAADLDPVAGPLPRPGDAVFFHVKATGAAYSV